MSLFLTVSRKIAAPVVALVVFFTGLGSALSLNFLVNQVWKNSIYMVYSSFVCFDAIFKFSVILVKMLIRFNM